MRIALALLAALALPSCSQEPEEGNTPREPLETARAPDGPTAEQLALLDSRDCRTVAQAYTDAIATGDFTFAARFWSDPVVDDARLAALFAGYTQPRFTLAEVQEEGAAGSLYCTVTGALSDGGNPAVELREGQVTLRRANDVPGATEEQLRWRIESSSFIEEMQRAGRGEPA